MACECNAVPPTPLTSWTPLSTGILSPRSSVRSRSKLFEDSDIIYWIKVECEGESWHAPECCFIHLTIGLRISRCCPDWEIHGEIAFDFGELRYTLQNNASPLSHRKPQTHAIFPIDSLISLDTSVHIDVLHGPERGHSSFSLWLPWSAQDYRFLLGLNRPWMHFTHGPGCCRNSLPVIHMIYDHLRQPAGHSSYYRRCLVRGSVHRACR